MYPKPSAARRVVFTLQTLSITLLLFFAFNAYAQVAGSGSIQGTVTDPTGAVVSNATVNLTEKSTNVVHSTTTTNSGLYIFPNITTGNYSLSVSAPGFQGYKNSGIVLEVGSSISINVVMKVGAITDKIEVTTETLALQTEDVSFKQTIDQKTVSEMPLNGRLMTDLIFLAGGAQSSSPGDAGGGNSKFPPQEVGISVAGAPGNTISYRLDGGDNNDYMGGENNPLPFPDAIGEFSVQTAALGAQDGTEAGGLVNVVTKSGTNSFHGSGFEFIRNNYVDATNFFATSKDKLHQNQYGGTFGGPILRNKLFAFGAFQRMSKSLATATSKAYVPTAANLAGDFSVSDPVPGSLPAGTSNNCSEPMVQLYDPQTGVALPGNKYGQPGGPALPTWNPAALALIKQLPVPTAASDPYGCGQVSYSIPNVRSENQFDTRVDYTISPKSNLYSRYFIDSYQIPSFYSPTNILLTTQSGNPEIRYQTFTIGHSYSVRSNLVNTVHFTATRRQLSRGFNSATPNASFFGIKDYQEVTSGIWFGCGTTGANHCNTIGGGSNLTAIINDNIPIDVADDVVWIRGKHQFFLGGEFVRNQFNLNNGYEANGNFNVNGQYSASGGKVGDGNLDFLEGAMNTFNQSKPQQNALRGSIPTLYVQDTYHATPRLTLTAGIHWQPLFFPHDYFHRGTVFSMAAFLANQHSTVYPGAPAGALFYGDPGVLPAYTSNTPWSFSPNFAFTYDPLGNGKTVFRAGGAYAYDQPNFFAQQRVQQNPPFSLLVGPNSSAQLCLSDPWLIGGTGNAGCGQTGGTDVSPFPQPRVPTSASTFSQQSQFIVLQPHYQMPNTLQWTASLQRELPRGWMVQVFYTGNRTQHLLAGVPLNPDVYIPGVWGPNGTGCGSEAISGPGAVAAHTVGGGPVGTPCSVNSLNTKSAGVPINNQARFALTMANPAQGNFYGGNGTNAVSVLESNSAYGNYNGLITTVQHRLSSTFSLMTNFTWSKCLNNSDAQGDISGLSFSNPNNPHSDYGRCGSDVRKISNTSVVLRSGFSSLHGITGYLVNNWELSPLIRLISGMPINVTESNYDESFTANGGDRPNLVPGVNPYNYVKITTANTVATRSYLNQAAFTANTIPGTQGNVSRNAFNGPVSIQDDAQVSRIFPVHEYSLDIRVEAFNFLNHPSFNNPNSSSTTFNGTFGGITSQSGGGSDGFAARVFQGAVKFSF